MAFYRKSHAKQSKEAAPQFLKTSYTSCPVSIPTDFLSSPPPSTHPSITYTKIDFSTSPIPEYQDHYAVVLDNVLSPEECQELIHLAELSAGGHDVDNPAPKSDDRDGRKGGKHLEKGEELENGGKNLEKAFDGWRPALVNVGGGYEVRRTDYRNSDRIIWDSDYIADRIFSRCLLVPQLREDLEFIEGTPKLSMLGRRAVSSGQRWKLTRLNKRLRFLRYGAGQFFRPHCDAAYETEDKKERTFYTLHLYLNDSVQPKTNSTAIVTELEAIESRTSQLYLNDSVQANLKTDSKEIVAVSKTAVPLKGLSSFSSSFPTCKGGATTFHSPYRERRLDVDPVAGRILIFQHAELRHSGDDVIEGTKYTLRSDILYQRA
ncbi:unnamed protein product [Calypogeia fissa]